MDVQFSGAVDFAPLFNNMNRPALPANKALPVKSGGNNVHAGMLQTQESILGPLSGGNSAVAVSTQLALNAGVGANVNVWA